MTLLLCKMSNAIDGKSIVNSLYHAAIISGLSMGYAQVSKMLLKVQSPKLEFSNAGNVVMVITDIGLAMATKDVLIKQGILPADILK